MKLFKPLATIRGAKKNSEKIAPCSKVDFRRTGLAFATISILSVLLSIPMLPSRIGLKVGDICPEDIIAPRTARYLDEAETELRRSKAAAGVTRVYEPIPTAADQAAGAVRVTFAAVEAARKMPASKPLDEKVAEIRKRLRTTTGSRISDAALISLLKIDSSSFAQIESDVSQLVTSAMTRVIHDDPADFRAAQRQIAAEARHAVGNSRTAAIVSELAQDALRPNQIYDVKSTIAQQEDARERVLPVYITITQGEVVVARGEPLLQDHIQKLEALGLRNPKINYRTVASIAMLVTMVVLLVGGYLSIYYPAVYNNTKSLLLLSLLAIIGTLALRISGSLLGVPLTPVQVGYLGVLWVVTVGMLVSVLVNAQVSVVIAALLSIVLSLMLSGELRYAVISFMMALVGICSVADIRDRTDLARTVGALAVAGIAFVLILGGLNNDSASAIQVGTFWAGVIVPIGAGAIFLIGTVPLERLFGLTTHLSLLELADTNKPLLRRLVMEAPGTYTHSMAVGHLAETAAQAIGADALTARVASYYHDIGKIRRPHFFIENQNIENAHDRINPTLSALVITSHIKDGVEIAREFKLPNVVSDVIIQHHGTSLVQYFYDQAVGEQDPCVALESQFRYTGPKPKSKEAAIIMLADSVEAASRAMSKPTCAIIELVVNRVIAEKLRDGQLDESDLSFKEVSKISDAFVRALTGTLHARIDYSEVMDNKKAANGDSDSKPAVDSESEAQTDKESGSANSTS